MKKIHLTATLFLFAISLMAQVPAGFSYQAVVRNTSGEVVASKTVRFRFTILQNSATGTSVYMETQSKATNEFGLANLIVGAGTPEIGSFNPSQWGSNSHFLKVELDPNNGNSFSHLGTVQLMAVPYAFHAKTVELIPDNSVTSQRSPMEPLLQLIWPAIRLQKQKLLPVPFPVQRLHSREPPADRC